MYAATEQQEKQADGMYAELLDADELAAALKQRERDQAALNGEQVTVLGYETDEDLKQIEELDKSMLTVKYDVQPSCDSGGGGDGGDELTDEMLAACHMPAGLETKCKYALKHIFKHNSFRPGQLEAITSVLHQQSSLVLLPTGSGKSLCYQLPALLLDGLCIVVSPLIALMYDQCSTLPPELCGRVWGGMQTAEDIGTLMSELKQPNRIKILFVSPEKILTPGFQRIMTGYNAPQISFVAIDEAHTISQWSHNFRPCYLLLSGVLRNVLNVKCILGLTATATQHTAVAVCQSLNINADTHIVRSTQKRDNLRLTVSIVPHEQKQYALIALLKSAMFQSLSSIIVYVQLQRDADFVAQLLTSYGLNAGAYHAGKSVKQRKMVQDRFMASQLNIIVATIAFGMGLNHSTVRAVIHYTVPQSIEHYVQEVGRAGRDGKQAYCHCFVSAYDIQRHKNLLASKPIEVDKVHSFLNTVFNRKQYTQYTGKHAQPLSNVTEPVRVGEYVCINESTLQSTLDMEVEVASTVLAYLQTYKATQSDYVQYVKFISNVHSTVAVSFCGDCPSVLATQHPVINAVLSIYSGLLPTQVKDGLYTVQLAQLALLLGSEIGAVQRDLIRLKWYKQIHVQWTEPALCVQILHIPTAEQLHSIAATIHGMFTQQETAQLNKVQLLAQIFSNVVADDWTAVYPNKSSATATAKIEQSLAMGDMQSQQIHGMINEYLICSETGELIKQFDAPEYKLDTACATSASSLRASIQPTTTASTLPPATLISDLYTFLHRNKSKLTSVPSAMQVARIAMGLSSPMYQASDWKFDSLWSKYKDVAFSTLQQCAGHVLIKHQAKAVAAGGVSSGDDSDDDRRAGVKAIHQKKLVTTVSMASSQPTATYDSEDDGEQSDEEDEVLISDSE